MSTMNAFDANGQSGQNALQRQRLITESLRAQGVAAEFRPAGQMAGDDQRRGYVLSVETAGMKKEFPVSPSFKTGRTMRKVASFLAAPAQV